MIGSAVMGFDITEQKRMEAALREAEMPRAVASLATTAAHESNNPLTVALGEAQLLSRERNLAEGGRLGSLIAALERIRDIVRRMNQITHLERPNRRRISQRCSISGSRVATGRARTTRDASDVLERAVALGELQGALGYEVVAAAGSA